MVPAGDDPLKRDPFLANSLFFSEVRGGAYKVECRRDLIDDFTDIALFVFGQPRADGLIPNLLIQFSPNGSLEALVEQLVQPTGAPNTFKPVKAIPRAPDQNDRFEEVIAEKVADRLIADLLKVAEAEMFATSIRRRRPLMNFVNRFFRGLRRIRC